MPVAIRRQDRTDDEAVRAVLGAAFDGEPEVRALEASLRTRQDSTGFVAILDDRVVGQVRLTRAWIDAEPRLVEVLVLSPLSVVPQHQGRGIGAALCAHAVAEAERMGAPAVFLEGSPRYYGRLGWRPASELGVTPPSERIPRPAFQVVQLPTWDDWMRGALVYPEPFWANDCVGLRGEILAAARRGLDHPGEDRRSAP